MTRRVEIFSLASLVSVLVGLSLGCSGGVVTCDDDSECFSDEYCHRGRCLLAEDGNQNGSGGNDAGHDADVDGDGGADADTNGDDHCIGSVPCSSGVAELDSDDAYIFRPGEGNLSRYGCTVESGSEVFVSGEPPPLEAQTCPDDTHVFRVPVYTCTDHDFTVEMALMPLDDLCPVDEWSAEAFFSIAHSPVECDEASGITTYCHDTFEEDGGYRWVAHFGRVSSPTNRQEYWPGLDLTPVTGASFPYELTVRVEVKPEEE